MNTHPQQETLSAYIDDQLDLAQMHHTARHLQGCQPCRASYASLQETRHLLRTLPEPPALPAEFWTNAYRELRVTSLARSPRRSLLGQMRQSLLGTQRRWAAGAAAAAVLAVAVATPMVGSQHSTPRPIRLEASAAPDVVDFSTLVRDHAQSAAAQPLADSDRQTMLSADVDNGSSSSDLGTEAASYGSISGDAAP